MHDDLDTSPDGPADADLVLRTRSGDTGAFGELWRRHYRSGIVVARSVTSSADPDDLVQEAYARIYQAIQKGGGPTGSFRAYLFTSIRNTAAAWGRGSKETAIDELDQVEDPASGAQAAEDALDRGLTHRAFRSLPTRWQEVLWYSEIEQMSPREIAPLLGMKPTAVAQLAFRAREGLREAWIQAHLQTLDDGSDCQWTVERLGAYARQNLSRRDLGKVEAHLEQCARCSIVATEAKDVSHRLALVLLPLTVGVTGAGAYLAFLQSGSLPAIAVAAMPSAVVQGAVSVTGAAGAAAAGSGAAAGGSSTAGGAGAGGAGAGGAGAGGAGAGAGAGAAAGATAGGALAGAGALVGLVAAGVLVVGGAVAAAVVLPGILSPAAVVEVADAAPQTDADTSAAGQDAVPPHSSSPSPSELPSPAPSATPEERTDAAAPTPSASPAPSPVAPDPAPSAAPETTAPAPTAAPDPDPSPTATPTATPDPTATTEPTTEPTPEPTETPLPTTAPVLQTTTVLDGTLSTRYLQLTVTGAPGVSIQAVVEGEVQDTAIVSAEGTGAVRITVTAFQWLIDAPVIVQYVDGERVGAALTSSVAQLIDRTGSPRA